MAIVPISSLLPTTLAAPSDLVAIQQADGVIRKIEAGNLLVQPRAFNGATRVYHEVTDLTVPLVITDTEGSHVVTYTPPVVPPVTNPVTVPIHLTLGDAQVPSADFEIILGELPAGVSWDIKQVTIVISPSPVVMPYAGYAYYLVDYAYTLLATISVLPNTFTRLKYIARVLQLAPSHGTIIIPAQPYNESLLATYPAPNLAQYTIALGLGVTSADYPLIPLKRIL